MPIPVAERFKAMVCVRLLAGIAVSNPAGSMDFCPLWMLSGRGLCDEPFLRPEESYRLWCVYMNVIRKISIWGSLSPRGLLSYEKS
jgi:hypothetical protein